MGTILLWSALGLSLLIARANTPRRRAIRARRRAEYWQKIDMEELSRDCQAIYHKAFMETPHLMYHQDVCWIEWHTKLADPLCEDPGLTPALLTPEQIAKDFRVGSYFSGRWSRMPSWAPSSFRLIDRRARLEQASS